MRSIFFAASYQKREEFRAVYEALINDGFMVASPIYDYQLAVKSDFKQLMQHSFEMITKSDIIVVEVTYKEIGIGIEAGYAKSLSKPIIYIRRDGSDLSTTMLGISTHELAYRPGQYAELISICNSVQ